MLEIAISESEKMLLKEAGFKDVISFCLLLSYGNIKDLKNQNEKTVGDITVPIKSQLQKLEQFNPKQIRIWYSSLDNEDVCTLYFLNSYFYEKNVQILVCDVTDENHFSLGSYAVEEIRSLEKNTMVIKESEQKQYNDEWIELVEENSDLRIINNNTLKSVSFDYLDKKILDILKRYESVRYWKLVGECMAERLCGFYGDIFFKTRVNELIKKNIIEVCEVKKEQNMIGEWKEQKYIRMNELYNIQFVKQKLNEYLKNGSEPELCIKINGNEYMIIPLKDKISFQWIGKSNEFYYNSVEELFSSELINGIILNHDWNLIEDIYYY